MHLLLLSLGCSGTPIDVDSATVSDADADTDTDADTDADADTDTDADTDADTVTQGMLNGHIPDEPVPAPKFSATNMDNTGRTRPDLIGHPSVLWFYPAAGTAG